MSKKQQQTNQDATLEAMIRTEALKLVEEQLIPKLYKSIRAQAVQALHLEVKRNPPLTRDQAWEILKSYPCVEMPYLTRGYILSLLSDQGMIHATDLDRYIQDWTQQGLVQASGDRVLFNPDLANRLEHMPLEKQILNLVREHQGTLGVTTTKLRQVLDTVLNAEEMRRVLDKMQSRGMLSLVKRLGKPSRVLINQQERGV